MNNDIKKVRPFDSFTAVFRMLVWAGYYKPLNKPTQLKRISHQIYRILVHLCSTVYALQHLIFTVQHIHDTDKLIDSMIFLIPQFNRFAQITNLAIQTPRIDNIADILNGPIFTATDDEAQEILKTNVLEMNRLFKFLMIGVSTAIFIWPGSIFVRWHKDHNDGVYSYMPFKTDTLWKFILSVIWDVGPVLWTGYGHLAIDQLIAAYHAHAQTQLKIIKSQLQRLCTTDKEIRQNKYIDHVDENIHERFKQIVIRYDTLIWYKNEVDAIFNFPLATEFMLKAFIVCFIIFKMNTVIIPSFTFSFLILLFCLLLMQVFLYCYYGNLVEFESRSINESLYSSEWLSLSPSFRGQMLIAMCRWSRPIQPRVLGMIPLSLVTFVQILKSSYSVYTVLVVTSD